MLLLFFDIFCKIYIFCQLSVLQINSVSPLLSLNGKFSVGFIGGYFVNPICLIKKSYWGNSRSKPLTVKWKCKLTGVVLVSFEQGDISDRISSRWPNVLLDKSITWETLGGLVRIKIFIFNFEVKQIWEKLALVFSWGMLQDRIDKRWGRVWTAHLIFLIFCFRGVWKPNQTS